MRTTRRECLVRAASTAAVLAGGRSMLAAVERARPRDIRFGMCDWTMGKRNDPAALELAAEIGLDGAEVDMGPPETRLQLRNPEYQKKYLDLAKRLKLSIPSVGLLELNQVPLMSEPRAAIWVADAIPVARALGARSILVPFFAKGELKAENAEDMRRVTEVMAELAPRAEKAGVVLGIESYLSAEDHLKILDKVRSPAVQVYYDVFNAAHAGHDPLREIPLLGRQRICQVHFKDWPYLEQGGGTVDWPAVVERLVEIRYDRWIVLEIGSPNKKIVADTKRNLAYVKSLFARHGVAASRPS
jgi:sugar phosphate isomerase/epimerase